MLYDIEVTMSYVQCFWSLGLTFKLSYIATTPTETPSPQ